MVDFNVYSDTEKPGLEKREEIINFLYEHLQAYGDPRADIEKAVAYALKESSSVGGFILVSFIDSEICGVVVVNETGMKDYIPENILVYIATHQNKRGQGIGKMLMRKTIDLAHGDIALHVEPENPARYLYEKVGFSSKYVEMRFKKA